MKLPSILVISFLLCCSLWAEEAMEEVYRNTTVPEDMQIVFNAVQREEGDPLPPAANAVRIGMLLSDEVIILGRGHPIQECVVSKGSTMIIMQVFCKPDAGGGYMVEIHRPAAGGEVGALFLSWFAQPRAKDSKPQGQAFLIRLK